MPNCPVCTAPMKETKHGDVAVDVCATHGMWLDKKELFHITEDARRTEDVAPWDDWLRSTMDTPVDHDRSLGCPHCDQKMALERYEGVVIDWCNDHGVWLDSEELEAILNNLRLDPFYLRGVALRLRDLKY
jgi:Zn-finger nucleic acid-binding protein